MKGGIGINQLSDSLKALINSSSGAGVSARKNVFKLSNNTPKVDINIDLYNKKSDVLLVFKNSVFINENEDYILNDDNSISRKDGKEWVASDVKPIEFSFIVLKSVPSDKLTIDGGMIVNGSINESALSEDLLNKLKNAGLNEEQIIKLVIGENCPVDLNTLEKIAKAIGNDKDFSSNISKELQVIKDYIPKELQSQLDKLNEALIRLNDNQLDVLVKLDLEEMSVDSEAGIWYDTLKDDSKLINKENVKIYDNTIKLINPNVVGIAKYSSIDVGFMADKLRYVHELPNNFISIQLKTKIDNSKLEVNNVSYEFID